MGNLQLPVADLLPAGAAGQSIVVSSGVAAWGIAPMTTAGDLEYATSSTAATRLAIGSTNEVLTVVGGLPAWAASAASTLTTTGDLLYASAANTLHRLAIGSTGQALTVVSGLPAWGQPSLLPTGAVITSTVTLTAATAVTMYTTTSLAIGTWKVHIQGVILAGAVAGTTGYEIFPGTAGTAVFTVTGPASFEIPIPVASDVVSFSLDFIIVVTTAGTINFQAYNNTADNGTLENATHGTEAKAGCTGWSAIRVA